MDPCHSASPDAWEDDAWEDLELGHPASWLTTKPSSPLSLSPLIKSESIHHIGRFRFSDNQLQYVLVNLVYARENNTVRDVVLVLRYKWPSQFRILLQSDLETVRSRSYPNNEAMQQWYASRLPEVTQLVNTFKIELREAEASGIRALAKSIELQVVLIILANKLFSDLSSADIALGLTNRYCHLVRGYRYVWMFPFTEMHVELVWNRSQVAQTEPFKVLAEKNGQQMSVRRFLMAFMRDVVAGRADKTLVLDPRSCGNERSAANLVEDVIGLFMSCVDSKDILGALMT